MKVTSDTKFLASKGRVESFISQYNEQGAFGYKLGSSAISPIESLSNNGSSLFNLASSLSRSESIVGKMDLISESLNSRQLDEPVYLVALLDSVTDKGFMMESLEEIAKDYGQVFGHPFDLEKLNAFRIHIRDHGPTLGYLSLNRAEFSTCVVSALISGDIKRENHRQYQRLSKLKQKLANTSEETGVQLQKLHELSNAIAIRKTQPRFLKSKMVRTLVGCCPSDAEVLCQMYNSLPVAPIG